MACPIYNGILTFKDIVVDQGVSFVNGVSLVALVALVSKLIIVNYHQCDK